jgi:MoxR-like ATPase
MRGRDYVLPEDVVDLVPDVLRHRLTLSYEALSDSVTADDLVMKILKAISAPDKPLTTHVQLAPAQA